jgi:hypothetical protein
MFPSKQEIVQNINHHGESFFSSLNKADLKARNSKTVDSYKLQYIDNITEFTTQEKNTIADWISKANKLTRHFHNLSHISWKIAKLCCNTENSFPHTIGDTIFLPETFTDTTLSNVSNKVETLIHEKIHIYQRKFPLFSNILIQMYWKYNIYTLKHYLHNSQSETRARSNPDLNNILYTRLNSSSKDKRLHGNTLCFQQYTVKSPKSLAQSKLSETCTETFEHPYEQMAYIIADLITNNSIKNDDYIEAIKWMKIYL